jgi:hydrogenase nickel incorporation protein HypA/HybF
MHELSIAIGIIDAASEEASQHRDARVSAVYLKLGALAGVDKDALLFSFDVASEGTPVQGARLDIREVPVVIFCSKCGEEREIESIQNLACSVCGELSENVCKGRELQVVALELEEVEVSV